MTGSYEQGQSDQARGLRSTASGEVARSAGPATHFCRVIAVTGGKGGVGKTNVAVNMSLAFSMAGARVLLMDADLGLANVDVLLGINPDYTLEHVIRQQVHVRDILVTGPLGLTILPGGTGVPEFANMGTLDIVRLLGSLRALEQEFDFLVIDTAAGIGNVVTKFATAANDVILVSVPEPPAMLDAYGVMKALAGGSPRGQMHLLVNMVSRPADELQTYRSLSSVAENYLGIQLNLLGSIPRDEAVVQSVKKRQPFLTLSPNSQATVNLKRAASYFLSGSTGKVQSSRESYFARLMGSMR